MAPQRILTKSYSSDAVITTSAAAEDASHVVLAPTNLGQRIYSLKIAIEIEVATPPTVMK